MKLDQYEVRSIQSSSFLARVIEFLKIGFNQSDLYAYKLLDYMLTMNTNPTQIPYGYCLFSKDKLEGALLTAVQGIFIDLNGSRIPVISLSDWYVSNQARGIPSLFHATKFIESVEKKYIITAYTFGEASKKIFTKLGFKDMQGFMYRKYLPNFSKLFFKKIKHIKEISNKDFDHSIFPLDKTNLLRYHLNFSLEINNSKVIFFTGVFKKLKIKNIFVKTFYILWTSDYLSVYKEFDNIHKFLLLKFGAISLIFYLPNSLKNSNYINPKYCREIPFMFKQDLNIDYISPVGSELSLGFF